MSLFKCQKRQKQRASAMWGSVLCVLGVSITVSCQDAMVGKGQWIVDSVNRCPDHDKYPYELDIKKRKLNRTHDGFTISMKLQKELTATSHGIYIEVCKKVDGGCRFQYEFDDNSCCGFIKIYAEKNFRTALENAGMDPPDCPIPEGDLEIREFTMDYGELPEDGMLGDFEAKAYLTEGDREKRVACALLEVSFKEVEDDDDDCEE